MERVEEPNREGKDCLSIVPTHGCMLNILSVHMKTSVDPEENSVNVIEGTFINPLLGKTHLRRVVDSRKNFGWLQDLDHVQKLLSFW